MKARINISHFLSCQIQKHVLLFVRVVAENPKIATPFKICIVSVKIYLIIIERALQG
jgi:hypothetical protein